MTSSPLSASFSPALAIASFSSGVGIGACASEEMKWMKGRQRCLRYRHGESRRWWRVEEEKKNERQKNKEKNESLDFSAVLLERLVEKDSELSFIELVEEAYKTTFKPWHGWISSAAYKVALKLIPERGIFVELLMEKGKDYDMFANDVHKLISLLKPLLEQIHNLMRKFRLDRLKST